MCISVWESLITGRCRVSGRANFGFTLDFLLVCVNSDAIHGWEYGKRGIILLQEFCCCYQLCLYGVQNMYGPPKNSMKGSGMEMSPLQKSVVELVSWKITLRGQLWSWRWGMTAREGDGKGVEGKDGRATKEKMQWVTYPWSIIVRRSHEFFFFSVWECSYFLFEVSLI